MDQVEFYLKDLASRFPKNREDYYLSYSGGRDSHFLYWFIKKYLHDDKIEIVGINTYMEHPQILKRMRENCDVLLYPKMKPFEIKEKYGIPCFSKEQDFYIYYYQNSLKKGKSPSRTINDKVMGTYKTGFNISKKAREYVLSGNAHDITHLCCHYLKKDVAKRYEKKTGKKAILAVRGSESFLRRKQYNSCFSKNGKFHPLYDLTDDMLSEIEKRYNIEVPEIYDHVTRTGCMGCPYGSYKHDTEKELRLVTKAQRKFLGEYFKESYEVLGIDIESIKKECGDYDDWEDDL